MAATAHKNCVWQPEQYLAFQRHRLRPAIELLDRVGPLPSENDETASVSIIDLGAGTCNMAASFLQRWPQAEITFVDSSQDMLDRGKNDHRSNDDIDTARFHYVHDTFEYEPSHLVDLIFANAALHWVSFEDHQALLPRLFSYLKPGGAIAVQMPDSRHQLSHQLMVDAGKRLGLDARLAGVRWVTCERDPASYYEICAPLVGPEHVATHLDMWTTTYTQILDGENPVTDFTSSTGLVPYLTALGGRDSALAQTYQAEYRKLVIENYPKQKDGSTLFDFKRFFLVITKPMEATTSN